MTKSGSKVHHLLTPTHTRCGQVIARELPEDTKVNRREFCQLCLALAKQNRHRGGPYGIAQPSSDVAAGATASSSAFAWLPEA